MKKRYRLKKNEDIAQIVRGRKKVSSPCFTLYYQKNNLKNNLYAISVGKKYGSAVERNYIKRVVREIMRPILDVLPNVSVVIVVKEASKTLKFLQLKEELTELINSINQKFNIEEN